MTAPAPAGDVQAPSGPSVETTLVGRFRGGPRTSRILFLDDQTIYHAWDEDGAEQREPVTTRYPPGHRECKALRSFEAQDFLLCMYWYTGPGGGRVDGMIFDLQRHLYGEFFSAAINVQLLGTLCYPDSMVGPMPSYTMTGWETRDASATAAAEVRVTVDKEGWTTLEAAALRARPQVKKYCDCVGAEDCPGEPTAPTETSTVVYALTGNQLRPTQPSEAMLRKIAAQWGHNAALDNWNLMMRGM